MKTTLWKPNLDKTILSTQSADAKLIHRPSTIILNHNMIEFLFYNLDIHRGISVDATLERKNQFNVIFNEK